MLLFPFLLFSQQTITLQECFDAAAAISPLAGEKNIYAGMTRLRDQNLVSGWLPAIDLGVSFSYQSDVTDLSDMLGSLPVPPGTLPSIPHSQHRATADFSQVLWDGGVTRSTREIERVIGELNMQQNDADLYRIREQVSNYFFSLLLVRTQKEVISLLTAELDSRINETKSGIENGVILPVALDALRAAEIHAVQQFTELSRRHDALAEALEKITGIGGIKDARLVLPQQVITGNDTNNNPDLLLFDIRARRLELTKELMHRQRMPKLFGFVQAGYGLPPGNNFLAEKADFYYAFGAGVKWNIWDWNRTSNEQKILTLQQQLLNIRKSDAEDALQRLLTLKRAEIEALQDAASHDDELILLHDRITSAAASQLRNGITTASQYLSELNNRKQAVIAAETRKIAIARAKSEYLYILGCQVYQ